VPTYIFYSTAKKARDKTITLANMLQFENKNHIKKT
jgi:hypothetical protein